MSGCGEQVFEAPDRAMRTQAVLIWHRTLSQHRDSTAFWARGGSAVGVTPPGAERMMRMPSGAHGDSMGGMTIAGG
ncbi:hypothetical protein ACWD4J_11685 [Streptomyces sp. NPDC002577]